MATVTKPIALDETLKRVADALEFKTVYESAPVEITLQNRTDYIFTNVSNLLMNVGTGECHIFLTTASSGSVSFSFVGAKNYTGDSTLNLQNGITWEFSIKDGYVIGLRWL